MTKFEALGLDPKILTALEGAGFETPTPIQQQAIPLALEGRDVMGLAQTGTGKTAAFGLPLIHQLLAHQGKPEPKTVKALVLAPTRELVNQISDNLKIYVKGTRMKVHTVVGGASINKQVQFLSRGTDILVATPGRLIDLMERKAVRLDTAKFLVLDEADQMLDMGFIHALRKIAPALNETRQTMLFSATMPKQMAEISQTYLKNPERVEVARPGKAADKITQGVHFVADRPAKIALLTELLGAEPEALSLVFIRTKHGADRLLKQLVAAGFDAVTIHGNKSQGQRERALKAFRNGEARVLVATDVAARGIDIPGVSHVYNFDLPEVAENYVHRIGRTARAGADGDAISLVADGEMGLLRDIEKVMKIEIPTLGGERPEAGAGAPAGKGKPQRRRRRGKPNGQGGGQRNDQGRPVANANGAPGQKPGGGRGKRRRPRRKAS